MSHLPNASGIAQLRAGKPHQAMFLRMLLRAAVLRRGRAASALLAMVVAAAAATAMLNLYVDVQAKLRHEFRSYGANVVVVAKEGQTLPAGAFETVNATIGERSLAVPFGYVVARPTKGESVVVAGTDVGYCHMALTALDRSGQDVGDEVTLVGADAWIGWQVLGHGRIGTVGTVTRRNLR